MTNQQGFFYMGIMIMCVTVTVALIHFPMWGSMFFRASEGVTEEDYYIKVGSSALPAAYVFVEAVLRH